MWLKTLSAKLFAIVWITMVAGAPALLSQTYLSADGTTDTYSLITSKLAPGANPIEVPDASHPAGSPHIRQVLDPDLGHYVFQFQLHLVQVTPTPIDNDPSTGDSDRQRNEIKTYGSSPEYLKAYAGETVNYRWKFKLDAGFQPSPKFTHIHQIKPVDGNDSTPVITYLPVLSGSTKVLQLRYYDDSNNLTSLKQVPLTPFLGTWVEANEKITFGTHGSYEMSLTRVSDGTVLMSYSNSDINLLRTGASFYRPKWGIYRSVEQSQYLRDEIVSFDNFCLAKGEDDCSAPADFAINVAQKSQTVTAGSDVVYAASVTSSYGFNGNVALSVTGLPMGATASLDQSSVMGAGSTEVKIKTTSGTPAGTYSIKVSGSSGTVTHDATVSLTVTPAPDFSLTVTPPTQTISAGGSTSFTANVSPLNGFQDLVAFGVSGTPSGTTASFDQDSVTGSGSVHLAVSANSSVSSGTYPLTIVGTSTSVTHTADIAFVIAGSPGFTVALTPASKVVSAGQSAAYSLTVTPSNGFHSAVTFACSGLPSGAQCSFSPTSVTPENAASTANLTITTLAPTLSSRGQAPAWGMLAACMPLMMVLPSSVWTFWKRRSRILPWVVLTLVLLPLSACGGGGASSVSTPKPQGGTPAGTYSVTVTANSGSLQNTAIASITVTP